MTSSLLAFHFLASLMVLLPVFLLLFAFIIFANFLSSADFKGWIGERSVSNGLAKLDPNQYRSFHDLYLPRPDGRGTTQLDHVVVSSFGIFVVETKNYKGWIFGSEKQRQWTQQIYRKKHRFQNPLHQNELHIRALMAFLDLPRERFHSLIYFDGEAIFKTAMPNNVIKQGLRRWIESHQAPNLETPILEKVTAALQLLDQSTDRKAASRAHLTAIENRKTSKSA